MSATTSGRFAPRVTARVRKSISSIVTGTVDSWPSTTIAGRVADEDQVDAGRVGEPRAGRVVGGDHDDLLAAALHLGELGQRELAGRGASGPGWRGRVLMRASFEEDVVDQADGADAGGGGEDEAAVEAGDLDVVGARRRLRSRARAAAAAASPPRGTPRRPRASARGIAARPALVAARGSTLRDESARPSASRTVGSDADLERRGSGRATSALTTRACCASFWPKYARCGRTMLKSFRQTVATPRKWPGRCCALEPRRAPRPRPRSRSRAGTSPPRPARRGGRRPPPRRARRRAPRRAGTRCEVLARRRTAPG